MTRQSRSTAIPSAVLLIHWPRPPLSWAAARPAVTLPFRTTSAVVKVVLPVAGHVAAAPLDVAADAIG